MTFSATNRERLQAETTYVKNSVNISCFAALDDPPVLIAERKLIRAVERNEVQDKQSMYIVQWRTYRLNGEQNE